MARFLTLLFLFVLVTPISVAQNSVAPLATQKARKDLVIKLKDTVIAQQALGYIDHDIPIQWSSYAWATTYLMDTSEHNFKAVQKVLSQPETVSKQELEKVMETVFACFPSQFIPEIRQIAQSETENPKLFANAITYLVRNQQPIDFWKQSPWYSDSHPIISALKQQLSSEYQPLSLKEVKELIAFNAKKNKKYIYAIHHQDRNLIGKVFVQNENGTLVKQNNQVVFLNQLARSATNLPMFSTNGNTPTGIYKINDLVVSENGFIGPTLSFATCLPFECKASAFFNEKTKDFTLEDYLDLLPKALQKNTILQQSFWAGKAGRSEIYFHGTTIDPTLYVHTRFSGQTPSLGCLCTQEIWDANGKLVSSDQQKLVDAYLQTPGKSGYAFVIELKESDWKQLELDINTW